MEDPTAHYQIPRNNSSASGSDEPSGHGIDLNNPPFSPNHYELGPSYTEENSIYENTSFDDKGVEDTMTPTTDNSFYQNVDFQDQKISKPAPEDEEYINPEEFIIDEATIKGTNTDSPKGNTKVSTDAPKGNINLYSHTHCLNLILVHR